jgi:hypothetical protein
MYNQAYQPDLLPVLKPIVAMMWLTFIITVPLRLYTNYFAVAALVSGLMKKHGRPEFSKAYLQRVMFDDNF